MRVTWPDVGEKHRVSSSKQMPRSCDDDGVFRLTTHTRFSPVRLLPGHLGSSLGYPRSSPEVTMYASWHIRRMTGIATEHNLKCPGRLSCRATGCVLHASQHEHA